MYIHMCASATVTRIVENRIPNVIRKRVSQGCGGHYFFWSILMRLNKICMSLLTILS